MKAAGLARPPEAGNSPAQAVFWTLFFASDLSQLPHEVIHRMKAAQGHTSSHGCRPDPKPSLNATIPKVGAPYRLHVTQEREKHSALTSAQGAPVCQGTHSHKGLDTAALGSGQPQYSHPPAQCFSDSSIHKL